MVTREKFKNTRLLDLKRYETTPSLRDRLFCNESWYISRLIRHVRFQEYHQGKGGWHKFAWLWHWYGYKRLSLKLHITIYPGAVDGGLRIYHAGGFTHIGPNCRIGRNCTIVQGVIFGNKYEQENEGIIAVGDNCYLGAGVKILGSVRIGNNVIVGANAVVVKDIPDNAVVGGVPAKIIRINQNS